MSALFPTLPDPRDLTQRGKTLAPGVAFAMVLAMAAQFLSNHYGAPVMLMAILLGIPFHFLSEHENIGQGITFAAKGLLRIGVALLGLRVSVDMVRQIGWGFVLIIALCIAVTILGSILLARFAGKDRAFGFLTGGSVAICGASAAMAISSILPQRDTAERDLSFTVISVTALSTLTMIVYPIIAEALGLDLHTTGLFLGGTIHDVAQVVGAGYSVSEETGDIATVVKLIRVTMLAPVVLIGAIALRRHAPVSGKRPPLLPGFVAAFLVLAALNSFHLVPELVIEPASTLSRALLVTAVAAVGMKTSIAKLADVGGTAIAMLSVQTVVLAVLILIPLLMEMV
ncbi:YeiH family protein [Donghicola mangrovi]|uniref:Putative sulfate exporter family transporter n=1 Tax=Donghicola mangrovi TaxID=2729614 RepID=A0A850QFJ4_9RHOB|nr:putative sulfate exporter family transporter [Donghicola mangrovi]NVO25708.1 putative sulfate exporter family transporter [Donghicola mangrovi]